MRSGSRLLRQREKEAELIWIGNQFREAIGLYCQRSSGSVKRYPEKLEDLLEDRRFLNRQRYLRKIYADPVSAKAEWGLVQAPEGGIAGVYSLADGSVTSQRLFTYQPPIGGIPAPAAIRN